MKNALVGSFRMVGWLVVALMLITGKYVSATTHVVQFGGSLGFVYSPASFSAHIGDTVKWEGDFSVHPLSSTAVPSGAATFHAASGSTFSYVIHQAGTYDYRCDIHFSVGMTGSFTSAASTVILGERPATTGAAVIRTVFSGGKTFVQLNLSTGEFVSGSLFTLDGKKSATIVSRRLGPGVYAFPLQRTAHGVQVLRFFAGNGGVLNTVL